MSRSGSLDYFARLSAYILTHMDSIPNLCNVRSAVPPLLHVLSVSPETHDFYDSSVQVYGHFLSTAVVIIGII